MGVSAGRRQVFWALVLAVAGSIAVSRPAMADVEEAEALIRAGKYDECARLAAKEIREGAFGDDWHAVKVEAEMALGRYDDALGSLETALQRYPGSAQLLWLARDVYRYNGRDDEAAKALESIETLVEHVPQRFNTPAGRILLGRFFLAKGADAKKVLERFYDVARKEAPELIDVHLATAELALEKQDAALAAETLTKAPKEAADDPRYHSSLARAYADSDRARAAKELAAALKINPRHVDSLILLAEHRIDSERYDEAAKALDEALAVNPHEPRAWACRAVIAHLRNDRDGEAAARKSALAHWAKNPEVDHLIGRMISQKYRFAEGSGCQKRSLELDPGYLPARVQLCEDLLRLGEEDAGWKLADEIFARDGYNVVAYNLVTLRDRLKGFRTLERDGFLVRMDPHEAELYGARVLDLLKRAKATLCSKYGVTVPAPVVVEIFPQKRDFAVRTFGLPGAEGFLGVCFGRVVTANSPASQGEHPSNWESVLWHEFCHVVTLTKTHNRMPRWLSEGISVYEEVVHDPAWAAMLSPQFRAMLLGKDLTPLSRLSAAFLAPESGLHLQFAYFETALAVEFLVQRYGLDALKGVLDDLGAGTTINDALPRRTKKTLDQLDGEFAAFARARAEAVAVGATWEEPELPGVPDAAALSAWLKDHPKSFQGLRLLAARLAGGDDAPRAREVLHQLESLYPEYTGPGNAYMLLAQLEKKQGNAAAEHAALDRLATRDGSASPAYLRLIELDEAAGNWKGVAVNARRLLAVNPLIPAPHRALAQASEHVGDDAEAIHAYQALALLDRSDPAEAHYRLATLLARTGNRDAARREVLKSLEEAPRFLDAHRLLLQIVEGGKPASRGDSRHP